VFELGSFFVFVLHHDTKTGLFGASSMRFRLDFEIAHGKEESFRDLLRVKRRMEAVISTVNYKNATIMTDMTTVLSSR
jgi:hypothetical protein